MQLIYILYLILGYLFGSLPWALIIGKVFYQTDIRNYGSGNLGGTNAGRVLGKAAGISVSVLDVLKSAIVVALVAPFNLNGAFLAGTGAIIGHCYPLFAQFKGGKAVSTTYGFLLTSAIILKSPALFLLPLAVWVTLILLTKYMSVASMVSTVVAASYSFTLGRPLLSFCLWLAAIIVIYRHKANLARLRAGNENKLKI